MRARERALRELARDRQKLALLAPGGSSDRPIEVSSSSVIEPRARSLRCPLCDGEQEIVEHTARTVDQRALRVVAVRCRRCGVARDLWFRIGSPLGN